MATLLQSKTKANWRTGEGLPGPVRYGAAVLAAALALVVRLALDPYLDDFEPYGTFYLAVAFAAWWAGWRAAVLATLVGYLAADWYVITPRYSLGVSGVRGLAHLAAFFFVSVIMIFLFHRMRRANRALRRARDELARVNAGLELTVLQRTARLRETVEELEHFSYAIVHDLRAPLRAMEGYAGLLERESGAGLDAQGREFTRRIGASARRMDSLIRDALNYGNFLRAELPLERVDLTPLVHGIVESYPGMQPPAAEVRIESDLPVVLGNEAGLTECFSNLLGNAVKFVAAGTKPRIRIRAERAERRPDPAQPEGTAAAVPEDGFVRVWIEDNGIGIAPEYRSRIFGMFERLHGGETYEGNGIGLAIVRKVVERMGGRVGVESEPGKGSRFWVELKAAGR